MMALFQILAALACLALPGEALLRWLSPEACWGWRRPFLALAIGQAVAAWLLWVLGMLGVPMWSWGIGIVLAISLGGLACRPGRPRLCLTAATTAWRQRDVGSLCLLALVLLATAYLTMRAAPLALEHRIGCIPGLGNWAYKTKLLLLSERWPADFFSYEAHNRRMGYPPGFPLLCGWCANFMGGLDTHAIRLLPLILIIASFALSAAEMVSRLRWWGLPGIAGLLALFLGQPGREILSSFYAEPLLLFHAAVAVVALGRMRSGKGGTSVAVVAAGALAWTKNEGLVLFVLLAATMAALIWRDKTARREWWIAAGATCAIWVIPWRIYLSCHGWHDESFSSRMLLEAGGWGRLADSWLEYQQAMFRHGSGLGSAWWLLAPMMLHAICWKNGLVTTLVLTAGAMTAMAVLVMMGSTEADLQWHLAAAPRVLLCPSLILLLSYAHILTKPSPPEHEING